jgi:lysophospholipase L1-like esterase
MRTLGENIDGLEEEGDTTAQWSQSNASGGTVTVANSWLTLNANPVAAWHRSIAPPAQSDYVIYAKVKAEYASSKSTYLSLRDSSNAYKISIALGYSWLSGSQTLGTIGLIANGGATKFDIATGRDYQSSPIELAIHVDTNRSCVGVYRRDTTSGEWVFCGFIPNFSLSGVSRLALGINNPSTSASWIALDYALCCRPNLLAFGDSVVAGHTLFDPNPSVYSSNDNASTWERHALLAQSVRNNLIVNKGVGGNTSTQMLSRIAEATAHEPYIVLLQASSNDLQASVPQATRTANHQACVNAIAASGAACYLLNGIYANANYSAWPNHAAYMQDWWNTESPAITGTAGKIDVMQAVMDVGGVLNPTLAQSDGIHLNVSGYAALGAYVAAQL